MSSRPSGRRSDLPVYEQHVAHIDDQPSGRIGSGQDTIKMLEQAGAQGLLLPDRTVPWPSSGPQPRLVPPPVSGLARRRFLRRLPLALLALGLFHGLFLGFSSG